MKILLLDIETAPNIAYVWGLFKQNIAPGQLVESGYVLSWSAKWLGNEDVMYSDGRDKRMLEKIHSLLSEADAVIHYNGSKFDIPTLNKEFLKKGLNPPATYKQIDLLKVVRKEFKFPSNKLDYVAQALKVGQKVRHPGFEMWIGCMNNIPEYWNKMEEYNRGDVIVLESVYHKLVPWIKNHPNQGIYKDEHVCPNCGSIHVQKRGYSYTGLGKFQRFQCNTCGTWSRDRKNIAAKAVLVQDKN